MIFFKNIVVNGFSLEESGTYLTMRPTGAEATAAVTIEEKEPGVWAVVLASGNYAKFARGKNRGYFEQYINQWALEATLQAL